MTYSKFLKKTLIRKESPLTWSTEQHVNDLKKFIEMYHKQQKDLGVNIWSSVCGEDTRSEIREVNENSSNILRATCHLAITYEGGLGVCTGFFVGPRKIVTAAHCLYDRDSLGYAVKLIARPGLHRDWGGDIVPPFLGDFAEKIDVPEEWIENGNHEFDYGLITLASDELFNRANQPFFTLHDADDGFLEKYSDFTCYGYPNLCPFPNQCFYRNDGLEPIAIVTRRILYSKVDISYGNSGGPLSWGGDMAVGICSHHYTDCGIPNGFTRITTDVKREIEEYPTLI